MLEIDNNSVIEIRIVNLPSYLNVVDRKYNKVEANSFKYN